MNFNGTFDVAVVGYGFAGAVAAMEAAKNVARVLILEKAAEPERLAATTTRWNAMTAARTDEVYDRPPGAMARIATPPFYAGEIWPVVSNTRGGAVHDAGQRIIDMNGAPIPRLFAAGEMGSCFGHPYLAGSNIPKFCLGLDCRAQRRQA